MPDRLVLGDHDPSTLTDGGEPRLIGSIRSEVVGVSLDDGAGIT
jgi:hypothetical protein